ncbi:hypothetical protein [Pseudogemmobacter sonorensis]|uniref:hypothetical protein n=1 Tax=Pseudogemmobacter sonorensis TaxID=2989681 RepID=UPI0036A1F10D
MSNSDSFIQEVAEEVRRDRLYGLLRRYGWIGVVLILGIVGGTAANEILKARAEARAQAFGDGLLDALDLGAEDRAQALATVPADGRQLTMRDMVVASDPESDRAGALAALERVIADASAPQAWRDLAVLRRVGVLGAEAPVAERRAALEGIAAPGRPYRALAAEQLAYLLLEEGRTDEAVAALTFLAGAEDAGAALRQRATEIAAVLAAGSAAAGAPIPDTAAGDAGSVDAGAGGQNGEDGTVEN